MRKIEIIEIENSYLNFFTPAVLVPVSYFLFNLLGWPGLVAQRLVWESSGEIINDIISWSISNSILILASLLLYIAYDFILRYRTQDKEILLKFRIYYLLSFFIILIILNFLEIPIFLINTFELSVNLIIDVKFTGQLVLAASYALTCVVLYCLFIYLPKLKIRDVEYKNVNLMSFWYIIAFFSILVAILPLFTEFYEILLGKVHLDFFAFFPVEIARVDMLYLIFFILFDIIMDPLFNEIIGRRTLIPTLEDRGLSPFHAVLLSAIGLSLLSFPGWFINPQPANYIFYRFIINILVGTFAGLVYVLTRNIKCSWFFSILYRIFYFLFIEKKITDFEETLFSMIIVLGIVVSVGVILYLFYKLLIEGEEPKLVKIIRKRSSPKIKRGIVGYFIICLSLLLVQTIVVKIGRTLFPGQNGIFSMNYFFYILPFYLIAFTIPFLITISTEWAKHETY